MRETLALLACLLCIATANAQTSAALSDPLAEYEDARILFERDVYGLAAGRFKDYSATRTLPGTSTRADERVQAELLRALAAQRTGAPEASILLERFIDRYSPQPIAIEAIKQVADNAFADKDYARAADYYKRLPLTALSTEKKDEVRFRLGYTSFASKDFDLAARYLGDLRVMEGEYQQPAIYYYGLTRFYSGDNAGAKSAFLSLGADSPYAGVVPGNLAQIYFADGEYQELITYAIPVVDQPATRQADQIHLLIGRSYFELKQYEEALPHLEFYAQGSQKISAADFYQLGYAQYRSGYYQPAAENLKQLDGEDSALGQAALYYLGNAYLQLDQRTDARAAFAQVTRLNYDETLLEEAAWNFAKLSYELGYDQDALTALQLIPASSQYYREAQALLSRVILKSRNYVGALDILNKLPELTPALRETKQQVLVLRGLQVLQERKFDEATTLLSSSLEGASDAYYKALANYWLGDIAYRKGELAVATRYLNTFLTTAKTLNTALPNDANAGTASYLLGYTFLRQQKYGVALGHFQEAVADLRRRVQLSGSDATLSKILGDAIVRAGDASFKRNDYAQASRFYEEAVERKYTGYVYALYQLAILEGLRGDETEKIIALETIVDDFPDSEFSDEALLELGTTYQSINQLNRAKQALERLVAEKSKSPLRNEALLQLGLVSINQGNTETAINYYKQVFSNEPKAGQVRRAQAALQEIYVEDLGTPDDYFSFLASVPGYKLDASMRDSISYAAAEAQYNTGKYDRAVEQYSNYLKTFPKGGYALDALWRRADSYLLLQDYDKALKDFEQIIQREDNQYTQEALEKAARIAYDADGDFAKAYRYYDKLLATNSERAASPELQLLALRAAYRSNNLKAVYEIAEGLNKSPVLAKADKALVGFYLGRIAYDRKEYDKALESFNAVIRNSDGEAAAEARYLVARIYFLRKEMELAENIAIAAQRQSSGHPYWQAKSSLLLVDIFLADDDFLNARAVAEGLSGAYKGDKDLEKEIAQKVKQVNALAAAASRVSTVDTSTIDLVSPDNN